MAISLPARKFTSTTLASGTLLYYAT